MKNLKKYDLQIECNNSPKVFKNDKKSLNKNVNETTKRNNYLSLSQIDLKNNKDLNKFNSKSFKIKSKQIIKKEDVFIEEINIITDKNILINDKNVFWILLIDDEKLIRESEINVINKYLKNKNILYHIEECTDGIEGLNKIHQGTITGIKYDIIITDETMNFFKGSFTANIIKNLIKDGIIYDIKIYIVTSYQKENLNYLINQGIYKIYSKPLNMMIVKNIFDEY